jgi:uncharacterized membrane protein
MNGSKIEQLISEGKVNQARLVAKSEEIGHLITDESSHPRIKFEAKEIDEIFNEEIDQLFSEENQHTKKLHKIVRETIRKEKLIINNLLHPDEKESTRGQRIADKVASFGGSWKFIISFGIILTAWIIYNLAAPSQLKFDTFPFILLNLLLSTIAALQAPVIMMSQNRQEEKDRMRSENDYLINLKAEMQIRSLQKKMNLLLEEQIKTLYDCQLKQLLILKEITHKIDKIIDKDSGDF